VKIRVSAPLQLEYESGNQEFPKGIQVDFFNEKEENYSRLTAKQAFYEKDKNEYTAKGDVVVENIENQEVLKTEELHWTPIKREIYTDKFVVITTPKEILKGNGLVAAQDFTSYEIKKPTGVFSVPEQ
jgi:LPS export ABC transporter protein LptC